MDLIKDGEVTNLANYANVELVDGPTAMKYATAFWINRGIQLYDEEDPPRLRDLTNAEMAANYIHVLRRFHRDQLAAIRVQPAGRTAEETERTAVNSEADAEIGTDE